MQNNARKKQSNLLFLLLAIILLGLSFLVSNGGPTQLLQKAPGTKQTIATTAGSVAALNSPEDITHTDIFAANALKHIFYGQINAQGNATGYHHESFQDAPGSIQAGTRTPVDRNGVYEAKVLVSGVKKAGNNGYSSFFPTDWSAQQVVDAIQTAYQMRELVTGNTWSGFSEDMEILMYLDNDDLIISAFPIFEN